MKKRYVVRRHLVRLGNASRRTRGQGILGVEADLRPGFN